MRFIDLAVLRRSVRNYKADAVEQTKLDLILDAGRVAPTACNIQPLKFILLVGEEVWRLASVYGRDWFLNAPAVIVVCCDHDQAWKRRDGKSYGDVDAAIAMDHMILQATELGLGTCWIGAFDEFELRKTVELPDHIEPVVMTPVGYPVELPDIRAKKTQDELVYRGHYHQ